MRNYEAALPEDYKQIFTIDAKNKKTALKFNICAIAVMLLMMVPGWFIFRIDFKQEQRVLPACLIYIVALFAIIAVHELIHGLAYKILTGRKLTFGLTLSVAYCGVPDVYVYRRTAIIAMLAPFAVFSIALPATAFILGGLNGLFAWLLFAIHTGSCAGDLYDAYLLLFRFRDERLLMNDNGPTQVLYLPENK